MVEIEVYSTVGTSGVNCRHSAIMYCVSAAKGVVGLCRQRFIGVLVFVAVWPACGTDDGLVE